MKWKVDYKDTKSNGELRTTYYMGDVDKSFVIDFFGLNRPDVFWYNVELVEE